jgi:hypothetical protein
MKRKAIEMPKFETESQEADWWAGRVGRDYLKQKAAEAQSKGTKVRGSSLVAKLNQKSIDATGMPIDNGAGSAP